MQHAIAAAAQQRYDEAKEELQQLLIAERDNTKALFLMARFHAGTGDFDQALEVLESIPADDAQFGIAAIGQRAEYLSTLGRLTESVVLWRQVLKADPQLQPARSALAIDLYRQGRRMEAGNELQTLADQGVASEDELRRLLNVTDPPPSRAELQLRAGRSSDSAVTLNLAWDKINAKQYRDALAVIKALEKPRPLQADVLSVWLLTELADFDPARATLSELPEDARLFPAYWLAVGAIHESESRLDQAVAAYERAMSLDPTREATHNRLSAALLRRGDAEAARSIDERRFALAGPAEAVLAIGPGQPDDAPACEAMIKDLVRLGRPLQAACWLARVGLRHPDMFGDRNTVARQIDALRRTPIETQRRLWSGGMELASLPAPELELNLASADEDPPRVADDLPSADGTITLRESAATLGIRFAYQNAPQPKRRLLRLFEQLGGGVLAMDYDRDGDADLFFAQAGGQPPDEPSSLSNELFRNDGDTFTRVGNVAGISEAAYSLGATFGDWNQDGFWDIVVANFGENQLLINQGDGSFIDRTAWLSDDGAFMTASIGIADIDGDDLPDLIEVNYVDDQAVYQPIPVNAQGYPAVYVGPNKFRSGVDRIGFGKSDGSTDMQPLIDDDAISFGRHETVASTDATASSQIPRLGDAAQPGLGLLITDLDGQGGLECFVANDARPNQCWRIARQTDGGRIMREIATIAGLATSSQGKSTACMGVGAADFDRDGNLDLMVTNWYDEWSNLYQQSSPGLFVDRAPRFGLDRYSDHHVGFGVAAQDFDNDGWADAIVGNGHVDDFSNQGIPQQMPTQVLRNLGGTFEELAPSGEGDDYFTRGHLTRCVVAVDLNRDGRQDVVTTDLADPAAVLINTTENDHAWVQIELVATSSERSAVGTTVAVMGTSRPLRQTLAATSGYMGRGEPVLHFGLGKRTAPETDVEITWPGGDTQTVTVATGQRHLIVEGFSLDRSD